MGDKTGISWCHHTFNGWIGCARISPGCRFCYADTQTARWNPGNDQWRRNGTRRITSDANWRKPLQWNRAAQEAGERRRVFASSLADVFEDRRDLDEPRARLFALIEATPWLDWLLLTKRADCIVRLAPWGSDWPLNVWMGVSVEDQRRAEERIDLLLDIPAAVRFLSCEPLIGPVDLAPWIGDSFGRMPESRGRRVSGNRDGRPDNRLAGQDLAGSGTAQRETENGRRHTLRAAPGREEIRGLLAGPSDVRLDPLPRAGASPGLASLQRPDSGRPDSEPQERQQDRELAGESGAGDFERAGTSRAARPESRPSRSVGHAERDGQTQHGAGTGDPGEARGWRAAAVDSGRLRRGDAAGIEDRSGRPPIAWLICGGESGAKARPMSARWARMLRDECASAGVPFHFKQAGNVLAREWGCESRTGHVAAEWPEPFPQEFPAEPAEVT